MHGRHLEGAGGLGSTDPPRIFDTIFPYKLYLN